MTVRLKWKGECHAVDILVVKVIQPAVIEGVNVMHKCGIKLEESMKKSVMMVEKDIGAEMLRLTENLENAVVRFIVDFIIVGRMYIVSPSAVLVKRK